MGYGNGGASFANGLTGGNLMENNYCEDFAFGGFGGGGGCPGDGGGGAGGYKTGGGSVTLGHAGYAASYASDLDFTGTVATRAVVIGAGSSGTGHTNGGCQGSPSNSHGAKGGDGQVVFKYTYQ